MTNTPDLASIVKPLEWEIIEDEWAETIPHQYKIFKDFFGKYKILYFNNELSTRRFSSMKAAISFCENKDYNNITSRLDLTKLQQPEPFWKPIEQCPKEEGKIYDLWGHEGKKCIRISDCIFDKEFRQKFTRIAVASLPITFTNPKFKPTHYAEIPPCEMQS